MKSYLGKLKRYAKRVIKAILNKPSYIYSTDKEYVLPGDLSHRFDGKVAVVTGGNGALGRAICLRLASEGAFVYVAGRSKEKLAVVVNEITELGFNADVLVMDITDADTITKAFKSLPRIDILMNCAGGSTREKNSLLAYQDVQVIDDILDMNLRGTILCCRSALNKMYEQKSGKVVNIASSIGFQGLARFSEYAATKSGVIGLTKSLALESGKYNVNVNCVAPGFIQRGEYTDEQLNRLNHKCPMNKPGTHEDIAAAVAFLASDEAGYITGHTLLVDGGRSLGLYGES